MELYWKHLRILCVVQIMMLILIVTWSYNYFMCNELTISHSETDETHHQDKDLLFILPPPDVHSPLYLLELATYEQDVVVSILTSLETHKKHIFKQDVLDKIAEYLDDYTTEIRSIATLNVEMSSIAMVISENPIFSFNMMWRFANDLPIIHELLQAYTSMVDEGAAHEFITDTATVQKWPKSVHVDDAMSGLLRIQMVYDLDPKDLFSGIILGQETGARMNVLQAFELGLFARSEKKYTLAIPWLELTLNEMKIEPHHKKRFNISMKRLEAVLEETMFEHDADWSNEAVKSGSYYFYKDKLMVNDRPAPSQQRIPIRKLNITEIKAFRRNSAEFRYWNLCAGQDNDGQTEKVKSKLTCWYENSNPALYINPIKTELLSKTPRILYMYDVISKQMAVKLVNLSHYAQAKPQKLNSDKLKEALIRTSVEASVVSPIPELSSFIEASTSLSVGDDDDSSFDPIIVEMYALGGHFNCRLDGGHSRVKANSNRTGPQIATIMFNLMDTSRGGQTVFPNAGIAVAPIKGSALFWYNLKPNGDVDEKSYHCSCPVALGHKTTATQRIGYNEQFRRVPCGLREDYHLTFYRKP